MTTDLLESIVDTLNAALSLDPESITGLVKHRVIANESLAEDPHIQFCEQDGHKCFSFVGLLNGAFSKTGRILASIQDPTGQVVSFALAYYPSMVPTSIDRDAAASGCSDEELHEWKEKLTDAGSPTPCIDAEIERRTWKDSPDIVGLWEIKHPDGRLTYATILDESDMKAWTKVGLREGLKFRFIEPPMSDAQVSEVLGI